MRKNLAKNVLRASAFTLACLALAGPAARAAAVPHTYSTSGTILNSGITDPSKSAPINAISFTPIAAGAFTTPSSLSLGQFQVGTLAAGKETDYTDTPFTITYSPLTIQGAPYPASGSPITLTGTLNGHVSGSQSSVRATFNAISTPTFTSSDSQYLSTLSLLNSPLDLVPATAGGITTVQAAVSTTTPSPAGDTTGVPRVPEPTTLAILATSIVGFGLRSRLRSARKGS